MEVMVTAQGAAVETVARKMVRVAAVMVVTKCIREAVGSFFVSSGSCDSARAMVTAVVPAGCCDGGYQWCY
jgi:hypothetical protein